MVYGVGGWIDVLCGVEGRADVCPHHCHSTHHLHTHTHFTLLHPGVGGRRQCMRWGGGGKVGGGGCWMVCLGHWSVHGGDVWCRRLEGRTC